MAVFDFAGSGSDEAVLDITAVRTGSTSSGFATTFKTMIDVSQLIKVDFWPCFHRFCGTGNLKPLNH